MMMLCERCEKCKTTHPVGQPCYKCMLRAVEIFVPAWMKLPESGKESA